MQRSIKGEVAWVTGGGTGIGQAGAVRLAAAGAKIVLTGRRREPLEETAKMIRDKGGEAIVARADMSKRDEVEAIAKRIADEHGRCDILVNSAGINVRNRRWADVDASAFDSVMDANLSGPFYATAAVLPMMRRQKNGLIIQISVMGRRVRVAAYRARLFGIKARACRAQRKLKSGGMRERHPLLLHLPRRSCHSDSRQAAGAGVGRR